MIYESNRGTCLTLSLYIILYLGNKKKPKEEIKLKKLIRSSILCKSCRMFDQNFLHVSKIKTNLIKNYRLTIPFRARSKQSSREIFSQVQALVKASIKVAIKFNLLKGKSKRKKKKRCYLSQIGEICCHRNKGISMLHEKLALNLNFTTD